MIETNEKMVQQIEEAGNLEEQKELDENLKERKVPRRGRNREVESRYKLGITSTVKKCENNYGRPVTPPGSLYRHPQSVERRSSPQDFITATRQRQHLPDMPLPSAKNLDFSNHVFTTSRMPNSRQLSDAVHYVNVPGEMLVNSKPTIEHSENTRPNLQLKQERAPRSAAMKLYGMGLSRSCDLMEKPTIAVAHGRQFVGTNRNFRNNAPPSSSKVTLREDPKNTSSIVRNSRQDSQDIGGNEREHPFQDTEILRVDSLNDIARMSDESDVEFVEESGFPDDGFSDTESVCSVATTCVSVEGGRAHSRGRTLKRGTTIPARFLQEATNRIRKSQQAPDLPKSTKPSKALPSNTNKFLDVPQRSTDYQNLIYRNRTSSQPAPAVRTGSSACPFRSSSPVHSREQDSHGETAFNQSGNVAGPSYFKIEVPKGKQGINHVEAVHRLKIFNNRLLQWRFVNARSAVVNNAQIATVKKLLYNGTKTVSELRDSVQRKKEQLQKAKRSEKLSSVINNQIGYLQDYKSLESEHSNSLSGAVTALQAATIRVPVANDVRADIQSLKEAFTSAIDVMQSIDSPVSSLLLKSGEMNCLLSELAQLTAQERLFLDECSDLLSRAHMLGIEESSLRAQLIQFKQEKSRKSAKVKGVVSTG